METTKKKKAFDAVKMMRDIRDKISSETQDMTLDELKAYIKQRLAENKNKFIGKG
jgi:CO dehydrogenase/acetyl-CoA synthase beta subunit